MSFAYSVAIKLTLANLASQGLKLLAGDLMAAHGAAAKLEGKLGALKMAAIGFGLDRVGHQMTGFLEKSISASKEYTSQLSLMNAAGMSQLEIAKATSAAWQTSRDVLTSTAADNLKTIRELRSVFGNANMGEAYAVLPIVQRTKAMMEALTGKTQDHVGFDMVKAIELRQPGLMSKDAVQRNAEMMNRSIMGMGGTVSVNDFHATLKQTKMGAFGYNDAFVYSYLPTLMQEVKSGAGGGAQSAGTALTTLYRAIVQGVIRKSSIPVWEEMGLIHPSDIVRNATGQLQVKPGGVGMSQLYQENPYAFAQAYAPIISKYGAAHHLNREQVISAMLGDRNAQWALNTMIAKAPQFERDRRLIESGGTSIETYQKLMKTNPVLGEQALHSQWQNVLSVIGFQILPKLLPLMVKFADGLDSIAQWMTKHPNLTQGLVISFGALAVSMSVLGKVMETAALVKFLGIGPMLLAALTPIGLTVAAITAVGVAGYELYKHWAWVKEQLGFGEDWQGSAGHHDHRGNAINAMKPKVEVHVHNKIDKHGLTTVVTHGIHRTVAAPQTSTSVFDGKAGLAPSGVSGAW